MWENINILIINTYYYPNMIGGTEFSIQTLANSLNSRGYNVGVFTCDGIFDAKEKIQGVNIFRAKGIWGKKNWNKLYYKLLDMKNPFILEKLDKVISEFRPDIIHTNNLFYISPYIWKYIKKNYNIPIVHTIRDIWMFCPRNRLLRKNSLCQSKNIICQMFREYIKFFSKYVDFVTAPSQFMLNFFLSKGYFENANAKVIQNSIDFDMDQLKRYITFRKDEEKASTNFLYIGRLNETKGINLLISTFKKINNKDISLFICGDGELKEYVLKQSEKDRRIKYFGTVYGDFKKEIFEKSDVLIMPSLTYEAFGRVIIEAYSYGLPIIAAKNGGISEIVEHCKTGIMFKPGDSRSLEIAIRLMSNQSIRKTFYDNLLYFSKAYITIDRTFEFERIYQLLTFGANCKKKRVECYNKRLKLRFHK